MKLFLAKTLVVPALASLLLFSCGQGSGSASSATLTATPSASQAPAPEAPAPAAPLRFRLDLVADNLTAPVGFTYAKDGSGRHFVLEQPGRIMILKDKQVLDQPFLDLSARVVPLGNSYSERGLLGLAFHPDFRNNGRFFVYYSAPSNKRGVDHTSVLAEYRASADNPDRAGKAERVLLRVDQPQSNHNGGQLAFGPDGYLYVGLGDGGGAGDKHGRIGHGLDSTTLLGSILRLDVNKSNPYSIPPDNPFVNRPGAPEIYAYGLRNPWRFSFDRETGQLYCADVGQNKYEEVNLIEKGKNYGWRAKEGFHVYDEELAQRGGFTDPINEYEHAVGNSVTGGYVYRGQQYPALRGRYIFGDWSGKVFQLSRNGTGEWERQTITFEGFKGPDIGMRVNSFGEGANGEIYLCVQRRMGAKSKTGQIYRLAVVEEGAQAAE